MCAQMKPGDLIFAEGKPATPNIKAQPGDIMHVEVFLGTGPEGKGCCGKKKSADECIYVCVGMVCASVCTCM